MEFSQVRCLEDVTTSKELSPVLSRNCRHSQEFTLNNLSNGESKFKHKLPTPTSRNVIKTDVVVAVTVNLY